MNKNYVKTALFSSSMMVFCLGVFAQTNNKTELKPVTTPIKKESARFKAVERPISKNNTVTFKKLPSSSTTGIRGTELIGEGKYLNFDKTIMQRSISGEIPSGFPKHQIGQSKEEYVRIMKKWGAENSHLFKPESNYLDYDKTIKAMTVNGDIPINFPKHLSGQSRQQYIKIMKNWSKENIQLFKSEYWSTINK